MPPSGSIAPRGSQGIVRAITVRCGWARRAPADSLEGAFNSRAGSTLERLGTGMRHVWERP
eukprot:15296211-Alexandrium_andersonii.AAC.1